MKTKPIIEIFKWLLGYYDFPERKKGEGAYWWRVELRKKLSEIGFSGDLILPIESLESSKEEHTTCDGCQMFQDCGCMIDVSVCPDCWEHDMWTPKKKEEIIKQLSGEPIEDIPTFTSTDYPSRVTDLRSELIKYSMKENFAMEFVVNFKMTK
jgi:hypothetical protein